MPFTFLTNPVKNLLPFLLVDLVLEPVNALLCFSRSVVIEKEFQHFSIEMVDMSLCRSSTTSPESKFRRAQICFAPRLSLDPGAQFRVSYSGNTCQQSRVADAFEDLHTDKEFVQILEHTIGNISHLFQLLSL